MTEFIIGTEKADKSAEIFRRLNQKEDGREALLIVPDQFSFDTEIALYKRVKGEKLIDITVTSFSKLSEKIIGLYSVKGEYADDIVKKMMMFRTLNDLKGNFEFYERHIRKPEFPAFMLDVISTLKSGGIAPADLKRLLDSGKEMPKSLHDKLSDIFVIYKEYSDNLGKCFSDRLDDVMKAARLAEENGFFSHKDVYFYSFEEFSGNQLAFVKTALETAKNSVLTLTTDSAHSREQRFFAANKLLARLFTYAGKYKVTVIPETMPEAEETTVVRAGNMYGECKWIAAEINSLVTEKGYRYKDIAVLCGNGEYPVILESQLKKYNVPAFLDIPVSIIEKPLARFALFVLDALSLETEAILRYIKTGFVFITINGKRVKLTRRQINLLESFARKWNVTAKEWAKPFPKNEETEAVEELRKQIVKPLKELKKRIEGQTGDVITRELCSFLMDEDKMNIESSIMGLCKANFEQSSDELVTDEKKVEEYRQLWSKIVSVFESAYAALEGYKIDLSAYRKLLGEIFGQTTIAKPPQFIDTVTVGDIERTRTAAPKIVFICGVNEGIVPASLKPKGAFSAAETELLLSESLPVGKDRTDRFSSELLHTSKAVKLPSEKLFLSYSVWDLSGNPLEQSHILKEIEGNRIIAEEQPPLFYCRTEASVKEQLAADYCGNSEEREALMEAIEDEEYKARLEAAFLKSGTEGYKHGIAQSEREMLKYLPRESYSPSAIETLDSCRYRYFCKYVLRLSEEGEKSLDPISKGNIIHSVMETVLKIYSEETKQYREKGGEEKPVFDEARIAALCKAEADRYISEELMGDFGSDNRFNVLLEGVVRTAEKLVMHTIADFEASKFIPCQFERQVSFDIPKIKDSDPEIRVEGKLDRLDVLTDENGQEYYRVADYKTGSTVMKAGCLEYGRNVQMLLYLNAICEEMGGIPSGAFYFPSSDEKTLNAASAFEGMTIEGDKLKFPENMSEADKKAILGSLERERKSLEDKQWVTSHIPSGIQVVYSVTEEGNTITDPATEDISSLENRYRTMISSGGKPSRASVMSKEEFLHDEYARLISHIESTVRKNITEVNGGSFDAMKYTADNDKDNECRYCEFKAFCGGTDKYVLMDMKKIEETTGRKERISEKPKGKKSGKGDK